MCLTERKLPIPLGRRFAVKDANKAHAAAEKSAAGKILLVGRRIQIRNKPQANISSLALTHNKFLKSEVPEREISAE